MRGKGRSQRFKGERKKERQRWEKGAEEVRRKNGWNSQRGDWSPAALGTKCFLLSLVPVWTKRQGEHVGSGPWGDLIWSLNQSLQINGHTRVWASWAFFSLFVFICNSFSLFLKLHPSRRLSVDLQGPRWVQWWSPPLAEWNLLLQTCSDTSAVLLYQLLWTYSYKDD